MKNDTTHQVIEIKELTETMVEIAIKGLRKSEGETLILTYGLILDCAYKIQQTMVKDAQKN